MAKKQEAFHIGKTGSIYRKDALAFLRGLKEESASVVFLDPPFNLKKSYGKSGAGRDSTTEASYLRFMAQVLREASRVLAPGGALYMYHLPKWAMLLGRHAARRLSFRHWIAVSMKNGFVRQGRLYPAHYALLMFSKGEPKVFNRPKVPLQLCRHCGKTVKDYGGYKRFVSAGVNVSDIWDDFSPVRHRPNKHRAANQLPLALLTRIVAISGRRKGVLVDPFVGTGTSLVAAVNSGMKFLAADREESACKISARRVRDRLRQIQKESQ